MKIKSPTKAVWLYWDQPAARAVSAVARTRAPSARWPGLVHSSSAWLIPPWLGTKIMPVGHNMQVVMGIFDEVVVLNHGQMIARGLPK